MPALAGIGVAVYLTLSWSSAAHLSSEKVWVGARARPYTQSAREGLAALRESGRPYALVDGVTPYAFVPFQFVPYNSQLPRDPVIDETVTFDVAGRDLFHVGQDGVVRPVRFNSDAGGDAAGLLTAGSLGVTPVSPELGERGVCVRSGRGDAIIAFTPAAPLTGGPLFLLMRYGSTSGKLLALAPEPVGGGPPPRRFVELPGGTDHTNVFALDANEMRRVYLVLAPEAEVCLQRLEVGRLLPR